ncbi:MAG: hypothetical protein ACLVG9_00265 [Eubacteriales bacterium]
MIVICTHPHSHVGGLSGALSAAAAARCPAVRRRSKAYQPFKKVIGQGW